MSTYRDQARLGDGRYATMPRADGGTDVLAGERVDRTALADNVHVAEALARLGDWSNKSALHWGVRRRVSVEDLRQEVMVQFLQTLANRRKANGGSLSGQNVTEILNPAYVHATARRVAASMAAQGRASEDQAGLRRFRQAKDDFTIEHNREMTSQEQDVAAACIRESFPAGSRPVIGYHRSVYVDSLDEHFGHADGDRYNRFEADVHRGGSRLQTETNNDEFDVHSLGARAMHAAEAGGKGGQAAIEELAWNSLAERMGAPLAEQGTLANDREVARTRKDIKALTDSMTAQQPAGRRRATVLDAMNAWESGDLGDDDLEPVFRPFGGAKLTAPQCDGISRVLKRAGHDRADELLDLAVRAAKTPRPQKVKTNA